MASQGKPRPIIVDVDELFKIKTQILVNSFRNQKVANGQKMWIIICANVREAKELEKEILRTGYEDVLQVYDIKHRAIIKDRIETKSRKVILVGINDLVLTARRLLQGKGDIVIEFNDTNRWWGQKTHNSRIVYQTMHPNGKLGNFNECVKNNLKYDLTIIILELYTDLTGTIVQSWVRDYNKSGSCIHICSDVAQLIADYNKTNFIEWEDHAQVNDRTVRWVRKSGGSYYSSNRISRMRQRGWVDESEDSDF